MCNYHGLCVIWGEVREYGSQGCLYGSPLEEDVTARFGMDLTPRKGCTSSMIRVNFHYVGGLVGYDFFFWHEDRVGFAGLHFRRTARKMN